MLVAMLLSGLGIGYLLDYALRLRLERLRLLWGGALGLAWPGCVVGALGAVHLLYPMPVILALGLSATPLVILRRRLIADARHTVDGFRGFGKAEVALAIILCLALGLLLVSGLRPPTAGDELDYHWRAPEMWAAAHSVGYIPVKLVNGFALQELSYTVPAVLHLPTAAHWFHTGSLVLAMLAGAIIATRGRVSPVVAAASVLGVPVALNQASIAFNDLAAGAFAFAALACWATVDDRRSAAVSAAALMAIAVSIKPLTAACVPPILVGAALLRREATRGRDLVLGAAALGGASAAAGLVWTARAISTTGHLAADRGGRIVPSGDPLLLTGQAEGRIPSLLDLVKVPFELPALAVIGNKEPFGGRVGILVACLPVLLLVATIYAHRSTLLRVAVGLGIAGWLEWILLAPVFPKTRFSMFAWFCLSVAAVAALGAILSVVRNRERWLVPTGLVVAVVGLADASRHLFGAR
jgi:hypothetical protein